MPSQTGSLTLLFSLLASSTCLLHVQRNEIRTFDSLDGLWTFVKEPYNGGDIGIDNQWNTKDLDTFKNATVMPVPCAYNDIGASSELRDHIGWVWYEKKEMVPLRDRNMRHVLRFGSVNYFAVVFVNSEKVTSHIGGHLPFEVDISSKVKFGAENKITVAVNNTLSWSTIPQGDFNYQKLNPRNISGRILSRLPDGAVKNVGNFDFFNYAGILRSVQLVKIPSVHIQNINIVADHTGSFLFETAASSLDGIQVEVNMFDEDDNVVSFFKIFPV
uniref:Glyco_hydro_2_N domain-containing protein n=1 Tax=Caenorhabditis tropicalis TaxID=1561998 RepID=A0A1I7USY8_9PELO